MSRRPPPHGDQVPRRLSRSVRRRGAPAAALLALLALAAIPGLSCQGDESGAPGAPGAPVPIRAGPVLQKTLPLQIRAIGNVQAYATVEIRARVGGTLEKVGFREGDEVTRGQLLFAIDPREHEVAVRKAEAVLARDRAIHAKAEADLQRALALVKDDFVTREEFDHASTQVASAQATVAADEAALAQARLELSYCTIRAPIDGPTGDLIVDAGNLVKANDSTPLVIIHQVRPIKVSFSVPQEYLSPIRQSQEKGVPLPVTAAVDPARGALERGELGFVDNAVDTRTGTIGLKADFSNRDGELWPGQFVDVVLSLGQEQDVTVVPSQAVQSGQQGDYVFVVRPDRTVEARPVRTARSAGGETVVTQGLTPGETVVTDGHLRLAPGVRVEVEDSSTAEEPRP